MSTPTGNLFNRLHPDWDFATLVNDRLDSGQWTEHELALTIKNQWLAHMDARYEDVLRDIGKVRVRRKNPDGRYPVRVCRLADSEHRASKRQYAHVFHIPGQICVAQAFHHLPPQNRFGVLLHEAGHIWAGPRGSEDAANRAAKQHSGVTIYYQDGPHGPELEWLRREDVAKAKSALGL